MNDLIINVEKKTRLVLLTKTTIGNDMENLQEKLVFKFTDTFVNGQGRLEYKMGADKNYIVLTKEDNTYTIPVQNVITKEGRIEMQLVITEGTEETNVPVFKSNVFYLYCNRSLNAVNEAPEGYDLWIEQANAKLNQVDEALEEIDNIDIDATKTGNTATVSITNKEGITKTVQIIDGENGQDGYSPTATVSKSENTSTITITDKNGTTTASVNDGINGIDGIDGKDAKINGVNTLSIEAGTNISIDQQGDTLTINATGGGGGGTSYEEPVLSNSAYEITDENDNVLFQITNTGAIKTKKFDSDNIEGNEEYDIDYILRNGQWGEEALTWYPNIVCNSVRIKGPFKISVSANYILYSAYSYTNKEDYDFLGATKILNEDTTRVTWNYTGTNYIGFNLISSAGVGSDLTILEPLYSAISMLRSTDIKENPKKENKTKAIRNAIFLGDSITHGVYSYYNNGVESDANRYCAWYWNRTYKTMPDYFSEYSGACVNNAAGRGSGYVIEGRYNASGNNISGTGPFYGNTNRKKETYNFANYDFVGVMEGINDYIQQANLGTFPTSGEPVSGTVTGNLALLIQKIISDNPLCKIVVYSPYNAWGQVAKGDSSKGGYVANETYGDFAGDYALGYTKRSYTLSDLVEAIDKVCKYYHIEHVKLSESNICNRLSIKDIMIEGLHSSLESMPKLAAEIFADKGYGE